MSRSLKRSEAIDVADIEHNDQAWDVVRTMVNDGADSSQLLELYYWSQEPGVVEMVRAFLEMSEHTRLMVGNFMLAAKPQSVVATIEPSGRLVLSQRDTANGRSGKTRQTPAD